MSFKVLVVPEDHTDNGYILKPLVRKMLAECGKPSAEVEVLTDPRVNGYEHAKSLLRAQIFRRYPFIDLFLFMPDADGKDRSGEFAALEQEASRQGVRLLCCAAVQEAETWLLAGHKERLAKPWEEVRSDVSVKENVFQPFLARYGVPRAPGGGRKALMKETISRYDAVLRRCPELKILEQRIRQILA